MPVRLIESLVTTEPLAEVFSDLSVLQAMLDFEVALARAEAELQVIPQSAARAIARAARAEDYDSAVLAAEALRAGTPGIPLVKALRKRVQQEDANAADFVHWGATSQDVADTALVLLLKRAGSHAAAARASGHHGSKGWRMVGLNSPRATPASACSVGCSPGSVRRSIRDARCARQSRPRCG